MLANPKRTKDEIVQWIRSYFESNGPGCDAVVGISGGKDSSVVAALCVEALGKERVVGVMMPNGEQPDLDDSKQLIEFLGIRYAYTDISKAVSAVSDQVALNMNVSDQTRINLPPRIRMATLYAISQSLPHGGRVANTCNRSEDYVGYSTKFGDSAGDFSPLANLMVHEVIQIGYELLLPINLISKIPSDGLCGKTDEDNLGFTYAHLDAYIMYGTSGIEEIDKKIASTIQTDAWFGYNIQKMCSVSASMATMAFNREFERIAEDWFHDNGPYWGSIGVDVDVDLTLYKRYNAYQKKMFTAMFDSRVFSVPKEEVCNCLIWRQQDATRNSIEAVGQANFSHHELHKKTCNMIQEMLWSQRGINWNDFLAELKRGSCCIKFQFEEIIDDPRNPDQKITVCRNRWIIDHEIPIFTQDREYIERLI